MEPALTVLMLHGRGVAGPGEEWPALVEGSLLAAATGPGTREGRVGASTARFIAPSYAFLTQGGSLSGESIDTTISLPFNFRAPQIRNFVSIARMQEDVILWGVRGLRQKPGWLMQLGASFAAAGMDDFQAYLKLRDTKDNVREWILSRLPVGGNLVVIGHSMGTLVALDLLHDLPPEVQVLGLVTLGSPLPYPEFHRLLEDHHLQTAARRARVWFNIVDPADGVTGGSGVATSWPPASRAIDFPVSNAALSSDPSVDPHSASLYIQQPAFGLALNRVISPYRSPLPWNLVSELVRVRQRYESKDNSDVEFLSLLRAIRTCSKERGRTLRGGWSRRISSTPMTDITFESVAAFMARATAAFWSPRGRFKLQTATALEMLFESRPFKELQVCIAEECERVGAHLLPALPDYTGLRPESKLWDPDDMSLRRLRFIELMRPPSQASVCRGGRFAEELRSGAVIKIGAPSEVFFLILTWIVELAARDQFLGKDSGLHDGVSGFLARRSAALPDGSAKMQIIQRAQDLLS